MSSRTLSPAEAARIRRAFGKVSARVLATVFEVSEEEIFAVFQKRPTVVTLPDSRLPAVIDFAVTEATNARGTNFFKMDGSRSSIRLTTLARAALIDIGTSVGLFPQAVLSDIDRLRGGVPLTRAVDSYILAWLADASGGATPMMVEVARRGPSALPKHPPGPRRGVP